jgi:hypothetical protein
VSLAFVACSVEVPEEVAQATGAKVKKKGGGSKGSAAQSSGQKGGSTASSHTMDAASQGSESDGLVCDASIEGIGWCADDASVVFCSGETWWLLDCAAIESEGFCGYDEELNIVDCYVEEDDGDDCADAGEGCSEDADCCGGYCNEDGACE